MKGQVRPDNNPTLRCGVEVLTAKAILAPSLAQLQYREIQHSSQWSRRIPRAYSTHREAIALPIPRLGPVMKMTFPRSDIIPVVVKRRRRVGESIDMRKV